MDEFRFSRLAPGYSLRRTGERPPVKYLVYIGAVCIGSIESTTPAVYPGRSRASYWACAYGPRGFGRKLGPAPSRNAAAELIVARLGESAQGRRLLARAGRPPAPTADAPAAREGLQEGDAR